MSPIYFKNLLKTYTPQTYKSQILNHQTLNHRLLTAFTLKPWSAIKSIMSEYAQKSVVRTWKLLPCKNIFSI